MKHLVFFFFLLLSIWWSAQTKTEFERRIPIDSFPEVAQEILSILPEDTKKKRFFQESSGDKLSYEVKFRYKKSISVSNLAKTGNSKILRLM